MKRVLTALFALLASTSAWAADYPNRPIRLVVPFAAGGGGDAIARPLAERLSETLGQRVIIDNKGGANGNIGAAEVAKAEPDGYTLLFANSSLPISASLYKKLPFDIEKDFTPVSLVSQSASVLVVHPSIPAKTVSELVALAKAQPGKLSFGSAGVGSTMHLAAELFKKMAGVEMAHVPYRGAGPVITDLIGGHISVVFINIPPVLSNIEGGTVRALAVTTISRSAALPDTPTLNEAGLSGYRSTTWYGIMAPAGLPREVVERLNRAVNEAVTSDDLRTRLTKLGSDPSPDSPERFAAFLKQDVKDWAEIIKVSGASAD
ncbi:tripartite tricarboxylate transporter substrate binding protein [Micromonospora sp. STR1s_5]|nr:tripartite tricarboxylate transporter substrate binding protein [Micromonospora sp. STR1s_5]